MSLKALGWDKPFQEAFKAYAAEGLVPARVAVQHRGGYEVWTADEVRTADVSGRFRHRAQRGSDYPAVGDWVAIETTTGKIDAIIHAVLPRRTRFARKAAGLATEEQLLATNIDEVFIVESLAAPPNYRRMERFLTLAWESGATPTIVLTKADLCPNPKTVVRETAALTKGGSVLAISCIEEKGISSIRKHLRAGWTVALLGPSGVGKSTLINHLSGEESQPVLPVRESDQKGRHTTTSREMIFLKGGGVLIDTPGLRELQMWEGGEGLEAAFADLETLGLGCQFTDCQHQKEPNCNVQAAVLAGKVDPTRLAAFHKLRGEVAAFELRRDERVRADEHRRGKGTTRSLRGQRFDPDEDS